MRKLIALGTIFALPLLNAGMCASDGAPQPQPKPVATVTCLPLTPYTPAQEKAMGAALAALPSDSPLVTMATDYGAMRSADRACLGQPQ